MSDRLLQVSPIREDDLKYSLFLGSLPYNQRNTPESEYRTRRGWELNGKPINFEQALERGMYGWDNSDKSYHGNSVAYNAKDDAYEFLKPKHHETVQYELDWFNKGLKTLEGGRQRRLMGRDRREGKDFRQNYTFDDSGKYYRYVKPNFIKRLEDPNRKSIPDWTSFKRNPLFNNRGEFTNNYVDDLINSQYPSISTHKMSYEYTPDDTGRAIVYPEVQEVKGRLVDFTRPPYNSWAGYDSALDRGDYLIMKDLEEARKGVEEYKDRYKNLK